MDNLSPKSGLLDLHAGATSFTKFLSAPMKTPSKLLRLPLIALALAGFATGLRAELEPEQQAKVDAKVAVIKTWAAEPAVVAAVVAHNTQVPADQAAMTQEKWKSLSVLDPFVRSFTKTPVGDVLKAKKADWTTEAFISDAKGLKVAFLSKPTNWSHAGKPKHDVPMTGKSWQGAIEVDESSGLQQLQIAVPVLKDGQPIGSLVVGLSLSKL